MTEIIKCDNCLTGLLAIKDLCECKDCTEQFFLSDFVPQIQNSFFDDLATIDYMNGSNLAKTLIRNAELHTLSELERAVPNNTSVVSDYESICSACTFTNIYTDGNVGQNINVIFRSQMSFLKFTKVRVKTNFTGNANLVIDDNVNIQLVNIDLVANTIQEFNVPSYITYEKNVKIYFDNPTIGLSNILCEKKSGCGCGGANKNASKWFTISGLSNSTAVVQQYGILPCVEVGCNASNLVCLLASRYKNVMAKYMAYQVALGLYNMFLMSTIKTESTLTFDRENIEKNVNTIEGKIHELMYGSVNAYGRGATNGIVHLFENGLRSLSSTDQCVKCEANNYISKVRY